MSTLSSRLCLFCRKSTGCQSSCACGSDFVPLFKTYLKAIDINFEDDFPRKDFHCCRDCGAQLGTIVGILNKLGIELMKMYSVTAENLDRRELIEGGDLLERLRRQIVAQLPPFPPRCKVLIREQPRPAGEICENQIQTDKGDKHAETVDNVAVHASQDNLEPGVVATVAEVKVEQIRENEAQIGEEDDHEDSASRTTDQDQVDIKMEYEEEDYKIEVDNRDESEGDTDDLIFPHFMEEFEDKGDESEVKTDGGMDDPGDFPANESPLEPPPPKRSRRIALKRREKPVQREVKFACRNQSSGCSEILAASELDKHQTNCYFRQIECRWKGGGRSCQFRKVAISDFAAHLKEYHDFKVSLSREEAAKLTKDGKSFVHVGAYFVPQIWKKDGHTFLIVGYINANVVGFWCQVLGSKETAENYTWALKLSKIGGGKQDGTCFTCRVIPFHNLDEDSPWYITIPIKTLQENGIRVKRDKEFWLDFDASCRITCSKASPAGLTLNQTSALVWYG